MVAIPERRQVAHGWRRTGTMDDCFRERRSGRPLADMVKIFGGRPSLVEREGRGTGVTSVPQLLFVEHPLGDFSYCSC